MQLALVHKKGPSKDELNVKRYGYIFSLWSDCFYLSCTKLASHRIATRCAYPYIYSLAVNLALGRNDVPFYPRSGCGVRRK